MRVLTISIDGADEGLTAAPGGGALSVRQRSIESAVRCRRSQGANPVTEQPGALHPMGQPIIASRKRGLQTRGRAQVTRPKPKIIRSGGKEGAAPRFTLAGLKPKLRVTSHSTRPPPLWFSGGGRALI